jgi:transcriptional regulator with XRE-family HTH domain
VKGERMEQISERPSTFRENLASLMSMRGLNQVELSEKSGVSVSYINEILGGTKGKRPGLSIVVKLADGLGVSYDYFIPEISHKRNNENNKGK